MKMGNQCRLIRSLLFVGAMVHVLYFILAWTGISPQLASWQMQVSARGMNWGDLQQLTTGQLGLGIVVGLPAPACMLYGLWQLNGLLSALQLPEGQKQIFSLGNIASLRGFAGALAISTVANMLETPLRHLAYRLLPSSSTHKLSVSVNSEELMLLLVCFVFFLVTGMMHEGRRLAEENEGFI